MRKCRPEAKERKTPELDDDEFERIQARLVAQKEANGTAKSTASKCRWEIKTQVDSASGVCET
jgi:hypothetical protein